MAARRKAAQGPAVAMPPELEERRRFLALGDDDLERLADLKDLFEAQAGQVVDRFYDQMMRFDTTRNLLSDPEVVARLKGYQTEYLKSLARGRLDKAYMENRLRIGRAHERIGLRAQWYLGAYGILLDLLSPLISEYYGDQREKSTRACLALTKLMNLDTQIVLDAYFERRHQKAVEKSEQLAAVGELSASIAHEVRNPLAGMKGALEVLRQHMATDPSRAEIVDELMAQIDRLENLVRDLLTFARPRPLSRQPVELHHLLDRVVRMVREDGSSEGVAWHRAYARQVDRILADPQQLEQVFLNLLQNALQAMEDGGSITVRTRAMNGVVEVAFQDCGKGISPADMARIFQPFFTTRHRGSGLGLAIVKKIVERHGGGIRIESQPGDGTTATVTLPLEALD